MHVSPGNKHIYIVEMGTAGETLPQEQKLWNPHYSTPCQKVWVSLPACSQKLQCLGPAHVESTETRQTTSSWERRRGNVSLAESIMRRLIGDDAKHLTTALKALALWPTEIAHSVPPLGCLIAPSLARRLSVLKPSPSRLVHISIRLDCLTPSQYNALEIASHSSSSSLCPERSSQLGK